MPDFQRVVPALLGWRRTNLLIPIIAFGSLGAYVVKCTFGAVGESNLDGVTIKPSQMALDWLLGNKMLKEFRIQNFRGLEDVALRNLGRINLIGGENGSGKTSVLETLWMFAAPSRPDIGYRVTNFRGVTIGTGNTIF